jgi:rSAM/selenodomain-associated transferase 2
MISSPPLSVVLPTYDAASSLPAALTPLLEDPDLVHEIIIADGGSIDETPLLARAAGVRVLLAPLGRGFQLAAGIAAARTPWLLLLHADTVLGPGWEEAVRAFIAAHPQGERAGYFRFALAASGLAPRLLERLVAWRNRIFALPYGDQGLLISRALLERVGGMPRLALMEDVALVRALGRRRLAPLSATALTSAEKWQKEGWLRRSLRNLLCLSLYALGLSPHRLLRLYRGKRA